MKILLPGCGNKINHIKYFKELPEVEKIIITDIYPHTYGGFIADSAYIVPGFGDEAFFDKLLEIYEKEKFDFCFPIHDYSLFVFSNKREYLSRMPYKTIMNCKETVDIVSDKLSTYHFFVENGFPTPKTYLLSEFIENRKPLNNNLYFIKPRFIVSRGTAKQFFMKIEDEADLDYALRKIPKLYDQYVIQEYVSGNEINVDFFCDGNGDLKSVVTIHREAMGQSRGISRGKVVFIKDEINDYVKKLTNKMNLIGANQIQVYENENELIFTEINGRFSGSSVLCKEAGVNFFKYFIQMVQGQAIAITEKPVFLKMSTYECPFFYDQDNYYVL